MAALLLWDWCVLIKCRAHHDNGVPRYPEVRQDAVIRHSGRSSSLRPSSRYPYSILAAQQRWNCPYPGWHPYSNFAGFFTLPLNPWARSRRRSKQDPDPGTPAPGLPEGGMGTRWVPVHEDIFKVPSVRWFGG